jgi:hypothetical protein
VAGSVTLALGVPDAFTAVRDSVGLPDCERVAVRDLLLEGVSESELDTDLDREPEEQAEREAKEALRVLERVRLGEGEALGHLLEVDVTVVFGFERVLVRQREGVGELE